MRQCFINFFINNNTCYVYTYCMHGQRINLQTCRLLLDLDLTTLPPHNPNPVGTPDPYITTS